jgi:murein L,D-transpeptidase YcbB/YkuD
VVSGQVALLKILGYSAGDVNQPDPRALRSALEEFQCDNGLQVDGVCGPKTQPKLKRVHGC